MRIRQSCERLSARFKHLVAVSRPQCSRSTVQATDRRKTCRSWEQVVSRRIRRVSGETPSKNMHRRLSLGKTAFAERVGQKVILQLAGSFPDSGRMQVNTYAPLALRTMRESVGRASGWALTGRRGPRAATNLKLG